MNNFVHLYSSLYKNIEDYIDEFREYALSRYSYYHARNLHRYLAKYGIEIIEFDEPDIPQAERLKKVYNVIKIHTRNYGSASLEKIIESLGPAFHPYLKDDLKTLERNGLIIRINEDEWKSVS